MSGHVIIDRRINQRGKNLGNRQRFIERAKGAVRDSAKKAITDKNIRGRGDTNVSVPTDGIGEPQFAHDSSTGSRDFILPGNHNFSVGDHIPKPPSGGGGGGTQGGEDGEFEFALSHDEFQSIILDDLDLPDMVKKSERHSKVTKNQRAGYATDGNPTNLDVERSAVAGISRRIALRAARRARALELEQQAEEEQDLEAKAALLAEAERLRNTQPPFLDSVDLRYRRFEQVKVPGAKAVMLCIMDVSGSMGEHERTISKRFFMLLALFLRRRYGDIDIVFVRHHHDAEECDEETFFGTGSTGGTVVSAAYRKAEEIVRTRYAAADWNIYVAQASDGDNAYNDDGECKKVLRRVLPMSQFFAYIEIERDGMFPHEGMPHHTSLWQTLAAMQSEFGHLSMCGANGPEAVIPVFRSLFRKKDASKA